MEAEAFVEQRTLQPQKRTGFLARFRRTKQVDATLIADKREPDQTAGPSNNSEPRTSPREPIPSRRTTKSSGRGSSREKPRPEGIRTGVPIRDTSHNEQSRNASERKPAPREPISPLGTKSSGSFDKPRSRAKRTGLPIRETIYFDKPPSAREAAFSGPPRYDWIDVETAAAVKVQAAFRRNLVMKELARNGMTTAAMRNRSRRLKAPRSDTAGEDVPSVFGCCGLGLAFGDGTEVAATREYEKGLYQERKKAREEREAKLIQQFQRRPRAIKADMGFNESFEIIE